MRLLFKFVILMVIVSNGIDYVSARPVDFPDKQNEVATVEYEEGQHTTEDLKSDETTRAERQIVQPKWLTLPDVPSSANNGRVKVTSENLKETAAIRTVIQEAVNRGLYAVNSRDPNNTFVVPTQPTTLRPPLFQLPTLSPLFQLPTLPQLFQDMPTLQNLQKSQSRQQNDFMVAMQRRWNELVERSRRLFNWRQ